MSGSAQGSRLEGLDLYSLVYKATQQIPEGRVSTYGSIARSLGDIVASRAVGRALNLNPRPVIVPCHRVVGSTGELVGFGLGLKKKKDWLKNEGIPFKGDRIPDLENVLFTEFRVPPALQEMRDAQAEIAEDVDLRPSRAKFRRLAALDVHYPAAGVHTDRATGLVEEEAHAGLVVYDLDGEKVTGIYRASTRVRMPYVPTYLAFRELPPLRAVLEAADLKDGTVLVFDGNGVLHPMSAGLASHCGVVLGMPSIGVAKSQLCGRYDEQELLSKGVSSVQVDGCVRGYAVKASNRQKKPVFISPGHLLGLKDALRILRPFMRYKVPEPVRWAHGVANGGYGPVTS